jgi:triacylglycerol esterase/lipase EstA (alpha/beta hydrolase family)
MGSGLVSGLLACAILLVPGAFGNGTSSRFLNADDYFAEYASFFRARGCRVEKAALPQDATIEVSALVLRDQLTRFARPGEKTALVAHSQGALDARYALKSLGVSGVSALISIGAPQSGTAVAEWAVREREREGFWYWALRIFGRYDLKGVSFAAEMTPAFLRKQADRFGAVSGVRYASAQGVCRSGCSWALRGLDWITGAGVGPGHGDGLVSGEGQLWGDNLGEYDLDHLSEVGVDVLHRVERGRFLNRVWSYLNPAIER